jgi:hypothetical protein
MNSNSRRPVAPILGIPLLAAATAAVWFAWLGWDTGYTTDETGHTSGPYAVWQVAGCVLSLGVLTALAVRWLHPLMVAATVTIAFTGVWSWWASGSDDSGLWAVGAVLVLGGMSLGSAAVAFAARFAWRRNQGIAST